MATPLCCLFGLPAECAKCGVRMPEGATQDFIWVLDGGRTSQFCSASCLVSSFIRKLDRPELG